MAHDVSGSWEIVQSNGYRVALDITQPRETQFGPNGPIGLLADGLLTGTADEITPKGTDVSRQSLTGELLGDSFEIVVDWHNGSKGQYSGNFDPAGHLSGVTFDVNNPKAQATWFRA
jgi:hypothetical protein